MTAIQDASTNAAYYDQFKFQEEGQQTTGNEELGKNEFLNLLVAQMNNQDPLSPAENTDFIAQLAQFSSLEGITNLNESFGGMAESFRSSQILEASSLVGKLAEVPTDTTSLGSEGFVKGSATVPPETKDVQVEIYSSSGAFVRAVDLGNATDDSGKIDFAWDGTDDGDPPQDLPLGIYQFRVSGLVDGERQSLETRLTAKVNSVSVGQSGEVSLKLAGVSGDKPISEVTEIL